MTDADRIKQLEAECASLRSRASSAESRLRSAGLLPPLCDLPNTEETSKLLQIVAEASPKLRLTDAERAGFETALRWCSTCQRSDRLNSGIALSWFVDQINHVWARRYSLPGNVSMRAFVCAALASGIRASSAARFPFDIDLGIIANGSAPSSSAWRDVLANGLPLPIELKRAQPIRHQQMIFRAGEPVEGTTVRGRHD